MNEQEALEKVYIIKKSRTSAYLNVPECLVGKRVILLPVPDYVNNNLKLKVKIT